MTTEKYTLKTLPNPKAQVATYKYADSGAVCVGLLTENLKQQIREGKVILISPKEEEKQ